MSAQFPIDTDNPLLAAQADALRILDSLTEKQRTATDYAAQDWSNDEIANRMGLANRTVEDHLAAARKKLGVATRKQQIRRYILLIELSGGPTRGFLRVAFTREDVETLLRDLSFEETLELLKPDEFEEFLEDIRSTGPEALDAKYPHWREIAGVAFALVVLSLFALALVIGNNL